MPEISVAYQKWLELEALVGSRIEENEYDQKPGVEQERNP